MSHSPDVAGSRPPANYACHAVAGPCRRTSLMTRLTARAAAFSVFLCVSGLATLQLIANVSGKEAEQFQPLFNGKDLSGWVTPEDKSLFTVEDGEIIGRTKGDLEKNEFLATE